MGKIYLTARKIYKKTGNRGKGKEQGVQSKEQGTGLPFNATGQ